MFYELSQSSVTVFLYFSQHLDQEPVVLLDQSRNVLVVSSCNELFHLKQKIRNKRIIQR